MSLNSASKMNNSDHHQWVKTASVDSSVKLAGDEAKDRLYEAKDKKKLVRVLTVVAYVFFVSLAAIMLSLYYLFLWNDNQKDATKSRYTYEAQHTGSGCSNGENVLVDVAYEPTPIPVVEASKDSPITPLPTTDFAASFESGTSDETPAVFESPPESDHRKISTNLSKRSLFLKKLLSRNLLE